MDDIIVIDDFLSDKQLDTITNCYRDPYFNWQIQVSDPDNPFSTEFLMGNVTQNPTYKEFFISELSEQIKQTLNLDIPLLSCYFNGQLSKKDGDLHQDYNEKSVILYVAKSKPEWGGFTQFVDPTHPEKQIIIPPLLGRLVCFPGNIIHKAYAYSHDYNPIRVSLVYKFGQRNFSNLY